MKAMNKVNYQSLLDELIEANRLSGVTPSLFLHVCCAPCSSYVLEYLSRFFKITVFYYNPNIAPEGEYLKRKAELTRLIGEMPFENPVSIVDCDYDGDAFFDVAKGFETCPEGGERCFRCYDLRLRATAQKAKELSFDYFASTLSISPLKNAVKLNEIGQGLAEEYGVKWLPNDFKKREGYKRSIELSREYSLYRQDYCGCVFSKKNDN